MQMYACSYWCNILNFLNVSGGSVSLLVSYGIVRPIQNALDTVQLSVEYMHTTTNHLLHAQKNTRREKQTHSHSCPICRGTTQTCFTQSRTSVRTHAFIGIQCASISPEFGQIAKIDLSLFRSLFFLPFLLPSMLFCRFFYVQYRRVNGEGGVDREIPGREKAVHSNAGLLLAIAPGLPEQSAIPFILTTWRRMHMYTHMFT